MFRIFVRTLVPKLICFTPGPEYVFTSLTSTYQYYPLLPNFLFEMQDLLSKNSISCSVIWFLTEMLLRLTQNQ